jgi:hypothetical protein
MRRDSTDGGATFTDRINLINSIGAESQDVEIAADGNNVIITWLERSATSNEPVMKVSTSNGETLAANDEDFKSVTHELKGRDKNDLLLM